MWRGEPRGGGRGGGKRGVWLGEGDGRKGRVPTYLEGITGGGIGYTEAGSTKFHHADTGLDSCDSVSFFFFFPFPCEVLGNTHSLWFSLFSFFLFFFLIFFCFSSRYLPTYLVNEQGCCLGVVGLRCVVGRRYTGIRVSRGRVRSTYIPKDMGNQPYSRYLRYCTYLRYFNMQCTTARGDTHADGLTLQLPTYVYTLLEYLLPTLLRVRIACTTVEDTYTLHLYCTVMWMRRSGMSSIYMETKPMYDLPDKKVGTRSG